MNFLVYVILGTLIVIFAADDGQNLLDDNCRPEGVSDVFDLTDQDIKAMCKCLNAKDKSLREERRLSKQNNNINNAQNKSVKKQKISESNFVVKQYDVNKANSGITARHFDGYCELGSEACSNYGVPYCKIEELTIGEKKIKRKTECSFVVPNRYPSGTTSSVKIDDLDYLDCDENGHIMARSFNGRAVAANIVPMSKCLNTGGYRAMENIIRDLNNAKRKVTVTVLFSYDDEPLNRPTKFSYKIEEYGKIPRIIASSDGWLKNNKCEN